MRDKQYSRQSSMQIPAETRRQIAWLAERWGLRPTRNVSAVIVKCVERVFTQEQNKND